MEFIDTHVHFYDDAYGEDCEAAIARSRAAGVSVMIQPDVGRSEREKMFEVGDRYPGILYQMIGLYPGNVGEDWKEDIEDMLQYKNKGIVAIGEIGLDYHYSEETAPQQKEALKAQLRLAAEMGLPVSIHLRDAWEDFFGVLEECRDLHPRGVIHAFSGTAGEWRRLEALGDWYAGIGGMLTFKHSPLPDAVREIPLERIVLETDAPYLAPVPYRGKRNESTYIPVIAGFLAGTKETTIERVAEVTTANARKLFKLP